MDAVKLRERLRQIVVPGRGEGRSGLSDAAVPAPPSGSVEAALGGQWRRDNTFVIEREWSAASRYGNQPIGEIAKALEDSTEDAALLTGRADTRPPFLFFDLETTGLNGGAGTYAFLVGC